MIPRNMRAFLDDRLPPGVLQNRVIRKNGHCFLDLGHQDGQLLACLGVNSDKLGPFLVACVWDERSDLEIGGYLVVDNLSMGSPSMGGIRMLESIKPLDVYNLARGMTLKNAAANLPYGGGKSGIVAPEGKLAADQRRQIIRGFAKLLRRYRQFYVPGPDVGTNDNDMKTVAIENGIDSAVSKPADMGGNRIDELGGAAGGVVIALDTLISILPRLKVLPQFADMTIPDADAITVLFQGFGAVGAHAARILAERLPEAKTIGISDMDGYLFDPQGLPVGALFNAWQKHGLVTKAFYQQTLAEVDGPAATKFSTAADDLLRESAFCMVPAAAVFHYLGIDPAENASMTVERMGNWRVIIEGANTYSPDPNIKAQRTRMEQVVYTEQGILIANDYLVNSGGVIFAAQEHIVPTPAHLQIPSHLLGDRSGVSTWLQEHAQEFEVLSEKRRLAGEQWREEVIRTNMTELVAKLAADANLLPCQAAEQISLQRLTERERSRKAKDIMVSVARVRSDAPLQDAAAEIIADGKNMAAVVDGADRFVGVITAWDITRALASSSQCAGMRVDQQMVTDAVFAAPDDTIIEVLRKLEENQISALPVVDNSKVLGLINSDLLAYRFLHRLLAD